MTVNIRKITRSSRGFTLVEVMVAITLLLIVVLPLASLYVKSLTTIQNAALYSQALALAHSRMELVEALDYDALDYTNPVFCPGFPFDGPVLPYMATDGAGNNYVRPDAEAFGNRNNPDTMDSDESYFDPTGADQSEDYPVPIYRDFYNNFTGELIDPNYNGLCDDDLNGDGVVDAIDISIGNPNNDTYPSGHKYDGQDKAGDGIYDTVVEGMYASSYDPTMWRANRIQECVSPILDYGLELDRNHDINFPGGGVTRDYRHREKTFRNFVRMTTIIDPTPKLADPNRSDAAEDWVDQYYFWERRTSDSYTDKQLLNLSLCLERDLPIIKGTSSLSVGVGGEDAFLVDNGTGLEETDPFKVNYAEPLYGKKVIVTVFYLSGEGEVIYEDLDGDGILDEMPSETYANAKRVSLERIFVNDILLFSPERVLMRDPTHTIAGLVWDLRIPALPQSHIDNIRLVPPQRRFLIDNSLSTPDGIITIPDIAAGDEYDPCAEDNDGLPYLGDRYWF